jgi:Mg-chelatase subunit ChlD
MTAFFAQNAPTAGGGGGIGGGGGGFGGGVAVGGAAVAGAAWGDYDKDGLSDALMSNGKLTIDPTTGAVVGSVPSIGKGDQKTPVLGDVPLVGREFRGRLLAEAPAQETKGEKVLREELGRSPVTGMAERKLGYAFDTDQSRTAGYPATEAEVAAPAAPPTSQPAPTALADAVDAPGLVVMAPSGNMLAPPTAESAGAGDVQLQRNFGASRYGRLASAAPDRADKAGAGVVEKAAEVNRQVQAQGVEVRHQVQLGVELAKAKETEALGVPTQAIPAKPVEKGVGGEETIAHGVPLALEGEPIAGGVKRDSVGVAEKELDSRKEVSEAQGVEKVQAVADEERVVSRPVPPPEAQPEVATADNAFSTFSLNVTDVSFKLAAASLEHGSMPDPATIRSEEFINAFGYGDPEPAPGFPVGFTWERAQYPFAQNREVVRFAVKTAARGREAGRPLNLVLLLDSSGSMERADRVRIIQEALRVLAGQLQPQDRVSVVAFARTARLWVDGLPGSQAGELVERVGNLVPEGGTNLEDALNLAYQTAIRHYLDQGINRVVLLTDGAANLGEVDPESLREKVEAHRRRGIALDCFGIGWEGYADDLLEVLSRHGDGRYGFVNTPEEAAEGLADQLAGALQVAAADVKVQVEFNPRRVVGYRQIGYAKHQLTQAQFRDNTVDAAELGAAESGNALYVIQIDPRGEGPVGVVRVRFKVPGTTDYREHEWVVPWSGVAVPLEQASPALRLAVTASAFSEWLTSSPWAAEVSLDRLLRDLRGVPEAFDLDPRPKRLEWMIRQAKSITGK